MTNAVRHARQTKARDPRFAERGLLAEVELEAFMGRPLPLGNSFSAAHKCERKKPSQADRLAAGVTEETFLVKVLE